MRKELSVYIPTAERGEELKIERSAKHTEYAILTLPQGAKVLVNRRQLLEAMIELDLYYPKQETTSPTPAESIVSNNYMDVEYGEPSDE